jgi:hypothetical protein
MAFLVLEPSMVGATLRINGRMVRQRFSRAAAVRGTSRRLQTSRTTRTKGPPGALLARLGREMPGFFPVVSRYKLASAAIIPLRG